MTDSLDNPHPDYGPCDGFGPNGSCCECSGVIERNDGSWVETHTGRVVKKPPLLTRIKAAWVVLRYDGQMLRN